MNFTSGIFSSKTLVSIIIIITNYTLLSLLFSLFRIFETRSSNSYCKRFCNKLKVPGADPGFLNVGSMSQSMPI